MCMALPGGKHPGPKESGLRRTLQWLGFGAVLGAFLAVGLYRWVVQRRTWRQGMPNG